MIAASAVDFLHVACRIFATTFIPTESCYGCIRFMKDSLKEKSPTARWLNDRINPVVNRIRDSSVTQDEIGEAKRIAREATHPEEANAAAICGTLQGPASPS